MGKSSFEEVLARDGRLVYTNMGDSMLPLIRQDRDLLVIEKPTGRLNRLDIPLYKRDSGQYVLHRILRVRERDYILCGDNRWSVESGVMDCHIIGVLTARIRDGKELSMSDWHCWLYAHLWCDFFPVRALILRILHIIGRLRKRT